MEYILLTLVCLVALLNIIILLKINKPKEDNQSADFFRYAEQQFMSIQGKEDAMYGKINDDFLKIYQILSENNMQNEQKLDNIRRTLNEDLNKFSVNNTMQMETMRKSMSEDLNKLLVNNASNLETMRKALSEDLNRLMVNNTNSIETMRKTLNEDLTKVSENTSNQLENIRKTVDDKLQETLDKKLNDSFKIVSERLEQVYKGLGEMQTIATSVGDLKKVLSNVKTRGVLGEVQLGAIIEQILSNEQYATNVATKKGSQANVEYAIKLPGNDDGPVWLPIDAKFPADAYAQLVDAYELGDAQVVEAMSKQLKDRLKSFAKDINTKYISPPDTTEFAIMFLPVEGLYAEAVRMGMVEILQNEYKVNIAGPTTMAALLNSLQMGFKTLSIQKRSSEVWGVLGTVKTEFDNFANVLESAQKRINQANDDLDKLIGVRTRKIQRTLKDVQTTSVNGLAENNEE